MNASTNPQCAHPVCRCKVSHDEAYCSEYCRKRVESPLSDHDAGCKCGHAMCEHDKDNEAKR